MSFGREWRACGRRGFGRRPPGRKRSPSTRSASRCVGLVRHENIPALPASDWSAVITQES
eukprot:1194761-Prorocentrum_minimum.AAC.2